MTRSERVALESRFEASNTDFRDAKAALKRALTLSLVVGLLTALLGISRLIAQASSDAGVVAPTALGIPLDLAFGIGLVFCSFAGRWLPVAAAGSALALWSVELIFPFVEAPALAIVGMLSPAGVALTLARVAALIGLAQGLPASIRMRRFLATSS